MTALINPARSQRFNVNTLPCHWMARFKTLFTLQTRPKQAHLGKMTAKGEKNLRMDPINHFLEYVLFYASLAQVSVPVMRESCWYQNNTQMFHRCTTRLNRPVLDSANTSTCNPGVTHAVLTCLNSSLMTTEANPRCVQDQRISHMNVQQLMMTFG
jgi:hypothetical protein